MSELINNITANQDKPGVQSKYSKKKVQLRVAALELAARENTRVPQERKVSSRSILLTVERSLNASASLKPRTREFLALKHVASFLALAIDGKIPDNSPRNTDLLPVGHPLSTRAHRMSEAALNSATARWFAADPRIDDSVRELVASAYESPLGSVEYRHSVARINALTAGLIPQDVLLSIQPTITAALTAAGGNSTAARSARANMQRRDRNGQFAFQGGGFSFFVRGLGGKITSVSGRFVANSDTTDGFQIEVKNDKVLKDGLYDIPASKAEAIIAVLPDAPQQDEVNLPSGVEAVDLAEIKPLDAPAGWELVSSKKPGEAGPDKVFKSGDGYIVEYYEPGNESTKSAASSAWKDNQLAGPTAGFPKLINSNGETGLKGKLQSDAPVYILKRDPEAGATKSGKKTVAITQSWADTQNEAGNDEKLFDSDIQARIDQEDSVAKNQKESIEKSQAAKAKQDKANKPIFEQNAKVAEKIQSNLDSGKDAYGNTLPEGWTANKKEINPMQVDSAGDAMAVDAIKAADYSKEDQGIKMSVSQNEDGSLNFNGQSLESWDAVAAAEPDYVKGKIDENRNAVKDAVKAYDPDGKVADIIDAGGGADEINAELENNTGWVSRQKDLETSWAVESPSAAQKASWAKLEKINKSIREISPPYDDQRQATLPTPQKEQDNNAKIFNRYKVDLALGKDQYKEIGLDPDGEYTDEEAANAWIKAQGLEGRVILDQVKSNGKAWPEVTFLVEDKDKQDFAKAYGYDSWTELNDDLDFDDPLPALTEEQNKKIDAEIRDLIENPPAPTEMDKRVEKLLKEQRAEWDKANKENYARVFDKDENISSSEPPAPPSGPSGGNTPGSGFSDYVIDLASGNTSPANDLQEQLDEDAEKLAVDFIENVYEDAKDVYDLSQTIKDDKPEGMSDKEFIDDAAAQMRENLEAIVDRAIEDRNDFVESGDAEPVNFDKETFINTAIERYKELVQEELDGMEEDEGDGDGPTPPSGGVEPDNTPPSNPTPDYVVPNGAYKLQSPQDYEPQGRDGEDSTDFTDDSEVIAGRYNEQVLSNALMQALIGVDDPTKDLIAELDSIDEDTPEDDAADTKKKPGPKKKKEKPQQVSNATGYGSLEFNQGEEFVPAEAIYNALKNKGVDVDMLVAQIYDSALGESTNVSALNKGNKEDSINAQSPTPALDAFDGTEESNMQDLNVYLASPDNAAAAVMQVDEFRKNNNGEPNPKIVDIASQIRAADKDGKGHYKILEDNIALAFSDDPQDKEAFQALWGLMTQLDYGYTSNLAGVEGLDSNEFGNTELSNAVSDAISKYNGSSPTSDELDAFILDNGTYLDFLNSKANVVNGDEEVGGDSLASGYYRLIAENSRYNESTLYRGIQVPRDSDELKQLVGKGNVVSFDGRPFSNDQTTAANFAGVMYAGDNGTDGVIFSMAPMKGKAADAQQVSPFPDENELSVLGNYKVARVSATKQPTGRTIYKVELEKLDKRSSVLEGYDSDYEPLLIQDNATPAMPEGYYEIGAAAYTPMSPEDRDPGLPEEFDDSPLTIARLWEKADLADAFRSSIEDGSGKTILVYPDGYEATIDAEAVRDALQIQGVDTNSLLDDISNAAPDAGASTEEAEPVESNVGTTLDSIIEDVSPIYEIDGWKKVGPQLGSNEGGMTQSPDGEQYYVKTPKSELHAQNETLAAALYRLGGVEAAGVYMGKDENGKLKTFSPDIVGKQDLAENLNNPEYLAKLQEGFAIDAWLGNWDVAGLEFDNVMSNENGDPVRVDPGGALLFRAMGAPKGSLFGSEVNELDSLRDPNMNPQSHKVFGSMTDEQQKESARKLLDISNEDIEKAVDSIVTNDKAATELKDKLIARRKYILDRYDLSAEDSSQLIDNAGEPDITTQEDEPAIQSPEAHSKEVDSRLDVASGWAEEYATDKNLTKLSVDRKTFATIAEQIDVALKDWRNGEISDEDLPGVLNELDDFIESFTFNDESADSNAEDLQDQLRMLQGYIEDYNKENGIEKPVAPQEEAPAPSVDTPVDDIPNNPYKDSQGTPIVAGQKLKYKKNDVEEIGTFNRYDKNQAYVWVKFEDGKKAKAISTKYLTVVDEGGGDEGPKAPEAVEPPSSEAPSVDPTPQAPEEDAPEDLADDSGTPSEYIDELAKELAKTEDLLEDLVASEEILQSLQTEIENTIMPAWLHVSKMEDVNQTSWMDIDTPPEEVVGDAVSAWNAIQMIRENVTSSSDLDKQLANTQEVIESQLKSWNVDPKTFDPNAQIADERNPDADAEEPDTSQYNTDFPFGEDADLNKAATDLTKTFQNGMPEGGEVIAVNEQSGMIAVTPDGETVYIFDGKKNTSYTTEGKPDYFKPGGAGDVFKWRPLTSEEDAAMTKKIADNAVPYGQMPEDKNAEGEGVDEIDTLEEPEQPQPMAPDAEPPAGEVTAPDKNGKLIWSGMEITDKDGNTGTVIKVNKDAYAFVKFPDGTTKWRSAKSVSGTGSVSSNASSLPMAKTSSKKATGAGVPPVKVENPSDWTSSDFGDVPSLESAIKKTLDTSDRNNAARGASAAVDSDSIEDLDVRFTHEVTATGDKVLKAKFKLTNWAAKARIKEILEMSPEQLAANGITIKEGITVPHTSLNADGMIVQDSNNNNLFSNSLGRTYVITTSDGITITIQRANKDDTTKFIKSYSTSAPKALHNLVTIEAPVDATPEMIASAIQNAGVTDVRPAVEADARVLKENRLMSIFDAKTDANVNLKGTQREESLQRIKDKYNITADDVEISVGNSGRIETRLSEEGAEKIVKATGNPAALRHTLTFRSYATSERAKTLFELLTDPHDGLLSTTARWTEGIPAVGQSSAHDIGTGGADYVFTKPVVSIDSEIMFGPGGSSVSIHFNPIKMYQRLDFYANRDDKFGKRFKANDVISSAKVGAYEVMFKGRVGFDLADRILVTEEMYNEIMPMFAAKGITTLGGRPLAEIIVKPTK